jgi:hypothetical protein
MGKVKKRLVIDLCVAVPISPPPEVIYTQSLSNAFDIASKKIEALGILPVDRIRANIHG